MYWLCKQRGHDKGYSKEFLVPDKRVWLAKYFWICKSCGETGWEISRVITHSTFRDYVSNLIKVPA